MSTPTSEQPVRAARPGGADGCAHFALTLQSALTRREVVDAFLQHVDHAIGTDVAGMYQLEPGSQRVLDVHVHSGASFLDAYEAYGREDDPVLQYVVTHGAAIDSSRLPAARWQPSGARQALHGDGLVHSMGAPVTVGGVFFGTINFARDAAASPFSDADLAAAESVADHLGRAIERSQRHERTAYRADAFVNAIDHLPQAVVVTTLDGTVLLCNRAAAEWELPLDDDGRVVPDHAGLAGVITRARDRLVRDHRRVVVETVNDDGRSAVAKTLRLAERFGASITVLFHRGAVDGAGPGGDAAMWEVLSPREQEIVQLVSQGLRTSDIARRTYISENTVKQHLKRIYAKTDVHNRAELVQLVWRPGAS